MSGDDPERSGHVRLSAAASSPVSDAGSGLKVGSGDVAGGIAIESVVADVVAEAARLRGCGALRAGFEEDLDRRFLEIAGDPAALAEEAATGASSRRDTAGTAGLRRLLPRAARRSRRTAASIVRSTRRAAAPRLRSLERSSIDSAGRIAESVVTRAYVAGDHANRLASDRSSGRVVSRLARISPSGRTLPQAPQWRARVADRPQAEAPGAGPGDGVGDQQYRLEDWAVERLTGGGAGLIVHVECGDGTLVRRLLDGGHESAGADPASGAERHPETAGAGGSVVRAGAFEFLGSCSRSSLGGLLLSGVTERLSPGSARALAHLAATRLRPGAVVVVLSAHPDDAGGDVVSADLSPGRPLHPVTWCHLLSRYGFAELTVNDPVARPSHRYAVAARMPSVTP